MLYRIQFLSLILLFCIYSVSSAQDTDKLIRQLKSEYENIEHFRSEKEKLLKASNLKLVQTKENIFKIKNQLNSINNELDNPIYFKNDIILDSNLDLVDFYLYEYSANYYQAFGRIKNKQRKYLEWVKLRFSLYNNGAFVATDYTYIDFESYGSSGISPYKYSFINTFIDKADFDSIAFQIQYDIKYGDDDILWDQLLKLESVVIIPSGNYHKWQGVVRNDFNYTMTFPCICACIMKQGRMVAFDYTYLDVQNNQMPANSSGAFDSYIDLPDSYDDIKYYLNYALYSLDGTGNLPPNAPIFVKDNHLGYSRINTNFEAFIIDPEKDRINLKIDFGNGFTSTWGGNFLSGYNANIQYPYPQAGNFSVRAKASDGNLETQWSENVSASIALSSTPVITTNEIENASYKKYYNFQLQSNGGIDPVTWQIKNGALPNGLSINSKNGLIAGVPLRSGSFEFSVYCNDSGIPSVSDSAIFQLKVNNQQPIITSPDSINTFVNMEINYIASATDPDDNPISFEFSNYPDWLSLSNSTLSGTTPNRILDTSFTLIATDDDLSDTMDVLVFVRTEPLSILSHDIQDAVYKNEYLDTLRATGGLTPYTWSVINGNLPKGLDLDSTGVLSGIPRSSGQFQLTAQVQDSDNPPQTDSLSFVLNVVNNPPKITSSDKIVIKKLDELFYKASAIDPEGNELSYQFFNYPSWLSATDSILSGIVPLTASDTSFTFVASDGELADTIIASIIIFKIQLSILSEEINNAIYRNEYLDTLKATGGLTPYTWSIISGNLPKGLDLKSSGVLSGIPSSSGHFSFMVQVQDSDSPPQTDSLSSVLNVINHPPQITSNDTICTRKNEKFIYAASATDHDGNELSYQFYNYPSWLFATDSILTGNVPLTASDTSFSLLVSDDDLKDSIKVIIIVYEPSSVSAFSLPAYFQLSEIYPNPFNPTTNIKIDLPENTKMELSIYDINGKLVQELYNGQLNAGVHILTWNANFSPSGIYFIRCKSNRFNKVIKCTLLK